MGSGRACRLRRQLRHCIMPLAKQEECMNSSMSRIPVCPSVRPMHRVRLSAACIWEIRRLAQHHISRKKSAPGPVIGAYDPHTEARRRCFHTNYCAGKYSKAVTTTDHIVVFCRVADIGVMAIAQRLPERALGHVSPERTLLVSCSSAMGQVCGGRQ